MGDAGEGFDAAGDHPDSGVVQTVDGGGADANATDVTPLVEDAGSLPDFVDGGTITLPQVGVVDPNNTCPAGAQVIGTRVAPLWTMALDAGAPPLLNPDGGSQVLAAVVAVSSDDSSLVYCWYDSVSNSSCHLWSPLGDLALGPWVPNQRADKVFSFTGDGDFLIDVASGDVISTRNGSVTALGLEGYWSPDGALIAYDSTSGAHVWNETAGAPPNGANLVDLGPVSLGLAGGGTPNIALVNDGQTLVYLALSSSTDLLLGSLNLQTQAQVQVPLPTNSEVSQLTPVNGGVVLERGGDLQVGYAALFWDTTDAPVTLTQNGCGWSAWSEQGPAGVSSDAVLLLTDCSSTEGAAAGVLSLVNPVTQATATVSAGPVGSFSFSADGTVVLYALFTPAGTVDVHRWTTAVDQIIATGVPEWPTLQSVQRGDALITWFIEGDQLLEVTVVWDSESQTLHLLSATPATSEFPTYDSQQLELWETSIEWMTNQGQLHASGLQLQLYDFASEIVSPVLAVLGGGPVTNAPFGVSDNSAPDECFITVSNGQEQLTLLDAPNDSLNVVGLGPVPFGLAGNAASANPYMIPNTGANWTEYVQTDVAAWCLTVDSLSPTGAPSVITNINPVATAAMNGSFVASLTASTLLSRDRIWAVVSGATQNDPTVIVWAPLPSP